MGEGDGERSEREDVGDEGSDASLMAESIREGMAMFWRSRSSASVREEKPRKDLRRSDCG